MSTDYNTYIGPFVTAHNPPKQSKKEHYGCPNPKCEEFEVTCSSKFCSECGTTITLVSVPCNEVIKFNVYKECNEKLAEVYAEYFSDEQKHYNIIIPNTKGIGKHLTHLDGGGFHSLNETVVLAEMTSFQIEFKKELAKICKAFGPEMVAYHWGVVQYTS